MILMIIKQELSSNYFESNQIFNLGAFAKEEKKTIYDNKVDVSPFSRRCKNEYPSDSLLIIL